MKRHILTLLALTALFAVSCSNDPIEVDLAERGTTQVSVRTAVEAPFSTFGVSDYKNYLGNDEDHYVAVRQFLYNADGKLVAEKTDYRRTLDQTLQKFDRAVMPGQYTLATLVYLVTKTDDTYASHAFDIKDTEELATLKVANNDDVNSYWDVNAMWYDIIGRSVTPLTVGDNDCQADITPAAVGSLVKFRADGFNRSSEYNMVGLEFKNPASGFTVADARTYRDSYLATNTWSTCFFHYGTQSQGNSLDTQADADIYIVDNGDVNWCFAPLMYTGEDILFTSTPSEREHFNFEAGKHYMAYIEYLAQGRFNTFLGTQAGFNAWYPSRTQPTEPDEEESAKNFIEPYRSWDATVPAVHGHYKSLTQTVGTPTTAEECEDGTYETAYQGTGIVLAYNNYFTSPTSGYIDNEILFDAEQYTIDEAYEYCKAQGYQYLNENDGSYYWQTDDGATFVMVMQNDQGVWLIHASNAWLSSDARTRAALASGKRDIAALARPFRRH